MRCSSVFILAKLLLLPLGSVAIEIAHAHVCRSRPLAGVADPADPAVLRGRHFCKQHQPLRRAGNTGGRGGRSFHGAPRLAGRAGDPRRRTGRCLKSTSSGALVKADGNFVMFFERPIAGVLGTLTLPMWPVAALRPAPTAYAASGGCASSIRSLRRERPRPDTHARRHRHLRQLQRTRFFRRAAALNRRGTGAAAKPRSSARATTPLR